jgi:2-phospho-L-lactate guanylyltransferase
MPGPTTSRSRNRQTDSPAATPWPWTVVLPVKGGPGAKTRLSPLGERRTRIAAAIAVDTVAAARATSRAAVVLVVTGDPETARWSLDLGATVVADPGRGLDAAVAAGIGAAPGHLPCAVLLADLPALRPVDLAAALDHCAAALLAGARRAVVPDSDGDGTVLLAAAHPAALTPSFGPGSAARHARGGVLLPMAAPRLRRDVDTPADLAVAVTLGVGPATTAAVAIRVHSSDLTAEQGAPGTAVTPRLPARGAVTSTVGSRRGESQRTW